MKRPASHELSEGTAAPGASSSALAAAVAARASDGARITAWFGRRSRLIVASSSNSLPACSSLLTALLVCRSHMKQAIRVAVIHAAQYVVGKIDSVDVPAALPADGARRVREVLVRGFQEAEVRPVHLGGRRKAIQSKQDAIRVPFEESPSRVGLAAQFGDPCRNVGNAMLWNDQHRQRREIDQPQILMAAVVLCHLSRIPHRCCDSLSP